MSKFEVGDKVVFTDGRAPTPYTVDNVGEIDCGYGSARSEMYFILGFWRHVSTIAAAPTKKRYEIIRVVEAENESQAKMIAAMDGASLQPPINLEVREIK